MSAIDRLDDHIEGQEPDGLEHDPPEQGEDDEPRRWRIQTTDAADWSMRKAARVQAEIDEVRRAAERRRDQIDAWEAAEVDRLTRQLDWWRAVLGEWHRGRLAEDPRGSVSIRLAAGVCTSRKKPDQWDVSDEFVAWAGEHHRELLRATVTVKGPGSAVSPVAVRHVLAGLLGVERVDELVTADEAPDRNAIKKALTDEDDKGKRRPPKVTADGRVVDPATGEPVPGVTWSEGLREFDIEPQGGGG